MTAKGLLIELLIEDNWIELEIFSDLSPDNHSLNL